MVSGVFNSRAVKQRRAWWLARYQRFSIPWLACFLFGVTLCAYQVAPSGAMPDWARLWVLESWLLVFFGLALLSQKRLVWISLLCLMGILLGGGYYGLRHLQPGPQDVSLAAKGYPVRVLGEWFIQSDTPKSALIHVQSVNAQPAEGWLLLRLGRSFKALLPLPGTLVAVDGRLSLPDNTTIPGAFQEKRYLASQGVTAVLHHPTRLDVVMAEPVSIEGQVHRTLFHVRHRIADTFRQALPSPLSEIQGGIVLGDQAIPVDRGVREQFAKTGLVHLLAASGMNVGIIAAFLFFLVRLFRFPYRFQILTAMAGVLAYALLSGLSPSVMRAATMLEIALVLKLADKTLNHGLVLLLAVTCLVLWNPELVINVGFQLSVLTTFGIIVMVPPLQEKLSYYWGEKLSATVLLPFVAQLWAMPLLVMYFNELPLLGVLLNILVVPMVALMTGIGFLASLLALIWQPLGVWLAVLGWPFAFVLHWVVTVTSGWTWAQWQVPSFSPGVLVMVYAVLFSIAYFLAFPDSLENRMLIAKLLKRKKIAVSTLLILLSFVLFSGRQELSSAAIHVLPLNERDTAFVLQEGRMFSLLLPESATPWYSRKIADYFRHRQIREIKALVWLPSAARKTSTPARQAVLETLGRQSDIQAVYDQAHWPAEEQASRYWRLSMTPGNTAASMGHVTAFQSLWQLRYASACIASVYRNASIPIKRLPFQTSACPLQYWQIQQKRHLHTEWKPLGVPGDRFFMLVYRDSRWRIQY